MSNHALGRALDPCQSSESELLTRYLAGDELAFRALFRRFEPVLSRYARSRVRCRQTADDLVQETFLNAHVARARFRVGASLRPWLMRILSNLMRDHFRRQRRLSQADVDVELVAGPEQPQPIEQRERARLTRAALATLREPQRDVVRQHWLEERPFPEIAGRLGLPVVTVKVRAHRAYKQLRAAMAEVA